MRKVVLDAAVTLDSFIAKPGGKIWLMGGGMLASSLIEDGVVDEVGLNIHPIVLGEGTPLFAGLKRKAQFELVSCEPLKNGCILASYRAPA